MKPLVAVTPWRRSLPTFVHPENDLYTIDPEYLDGIERAGGIGALVGFVDEAGARETLQRFDALLLSGGDDIDPAQYSASAAGAVSTNPAADESDQHLLQAALEIGIPVLGVCRGIQLINVALGGSLHQHMWDTSVEHRGRETGPDPVHNAEEMLARRHLVQFESGSSIAKIFGSNTTEANSLHHQAVDQLGDGLTVTGRTADGVVEVVEHVEHALIAVQWHPERMPNGSHDPLFSWLVDQAADRQAT